MNSESGVYAPESSAADPVTTLNVEPGGYSPWVARSRSGAANEQARVRRLRILLKPFATALELKVGLDASARTRPVDGSSATAAPHDPLSAFTAVRWAGTLSVR